MINLKYVLDGKEPRPTASIDEWGRMLEDGEMRTVARDEIDGVLVSTVFVGIDLRVGGEGPPLLFETMIFGGEHDQDCERTASWKEAEVAHAAAVMLVKGRADG